MPRTYTTSGVTIIGNGEESGVWGNLTNTNLQILDRMTSQAGAISLSGTTHTLTISDGVLSDGQYAALVFGGSPSGTNTVTISPNDARRLFFVKNNSGETVTLTQGSGGDVSILDGRSAVVYCDGAGTGAEVVDLSSTLVTETAQDIGALSPGDGNFIVGDGTTWVTESGDTVLASLGVTATTAELNLLDGSTLALSSVTATADDLNILDGVTATTEELNYVDGVTSSIQTQLNAKAPSESPSFTGTPEAPTAAVDTNTTQIATTAFVRGQVLDEDDMASDDADRPPSQQSVKAYVETQSPVKAWVNFNGTGTVAIRDSFNVSSITDNGTGDFTVNFTSALASADYAVVAIGGGPSSPNDSKGMMSIVSQSAASVQVKSGVRNVFFPADLEIVNMIAVR